MTQPNINDALADLFKGIGYLKKGMKKMKTLNVVVYDKIEEPISTLDEVITDAIVDSDRSGPNIGPTSARIDDRSNHVFSEPYQGYNPVRTPEFPPGLGFPSSIHREDESLDDIQPPFSPLVGESRLSSGSSGSNLSPIAPPFSPSGVRMNRIYTPPPGYQNNLHGGRLLFISPFPEGLSEEEFYGVISTYGRVDHGPWYYPAPSDGQGSSYAFIIMASNDDARQVQHVLDNTDNDGTLVMVKIAPPQGIPRPNFASNFPRVLRSSQDNVHQETSLNKSPGTSTKELQPQPYPQESPILSAQSFQNTTDPTPAEASKSSRGSSWAKITGKGVTETKSYSIRPANQPALRRGSSVRGNGFVQLGRPKESPASQLRVLFIINLPPNITLEKVSDAIQEGPIAAIRFGVDEEDHKPYVGIIFQNAVDLDDFHLVLKREKREQRARRFTFMPEVVIGEPHPITATIHAMMPPVFARRRLTIVKKGLFFKWGKRDLESLCYRVAGKENVQLVFLYNGGNATVCFSDVELAIKVKAELEAMERRGKGFEGLVVSYSKDPCETPMRLISAGV